MAVDFGEITEGNWAEFYARMSVLNGLHPGWYPVEHYTPAAIKRRIGLHTNVTTLTDLQREGKIADAEMYRVFNCGIGMTVHVRPSDAARAIGILGEAGQEALVIGEVRTGTRGVVIA